MTAYYLKATDEDELRQALLATNVITEEAPVEGFNLDVIGTIYKPTGNMLSLGPDDHLEYPEVLPVEGYHANLLGELSEEQQAALAPLLITAPANPFRVWA